MTVHPHYFHSRHNLHIQARSRQPPQSLKALQCYNIPSTHNFLILIISQPANHTEIPCLGSNYITYCMSRYRNVANLAHVKANIHLIVEDYD